MTLDPSIVREAARRLHAAEQSGKQIRHFSREHPQMDIADAYAIQSAWIDLKLAEGRRIKGHKIGLTSKAMQYSSQIDEPEYGVLLDDMFFAEGSDIPTDRFIVPRLEVELAFILNKRLSGPECTIFDVLRATDYVVPALEIIDARIEHERDQLLAYEDDARRRYLRVHATGFALVMFSRQTSGYWRA